MKVDAIINPRINQTLNWHITYMDVSSGCQLLSFGNLDYYENFIFSLLNFIRFPAHIKYTIKYASPTVKSEALTESFRWVT